MDAELSLDSGNLAFQRALAQGGNNNDPDLAAINSAIGLDLLAGAMPEDVRNTLLALRSKSLANIGAVIPVERGDRRYPLFVAQTAYLSGKLDSAWLQYTSSRDLIGTATR